MIDRTDEDDEAMRGRREYDDPDIIDTTHKLTYDEVVELKRIAQLSKTTRAFVVVLMAIVTLIGVPTVLSWTQKHLGW
jgi:hypothetical protein